MVSAGRGWRALCVRGTAEGAYESVKVAGAGGAGGVGSAAGAAAAAAYWWWQVAGARHRHRRASQTLEFHEHLHRTQDHHGCAIGGGGGPGAGTMPRARRVVRCGVRVALSASTGALSPPDAPALLLLQRWRPPHAHAHQHPHAPRPSCSYHLLPESQRLHCALPGGERSCCEADTQPSDSGSELDEEPARAEQDRAGRALEEAAPDSLDPLDEPDFEEEQERGYHLHEHVGHIEHNDDLSD